MSFSTQTKGYGECPKRLGFHLPLFTQTDFHYLPWRGEQDDNILRLHYASLNFTPPLHFDNKTLQSLDKTFALLDGQFSQQMTRLNDFLTYIAFGLAFANTVFICFSHCGRFRQKSRTFLQAKPFRRKKRSGLKSRKTSTDSIALTTAPSANNCDHESDASIFNADNSPELEPIGPSCSKCFKLRPQRSTTQT